MKYIKLAQIFVHKHIPKSFRTWNMDYVNKQPLGRWDVDYCKEKINIKIDLANVDNCGTCTHYLIKK